MTQKDEDQADEVLPPFVMGTATVRCSDGEHVVPAMVHPLAPGLAITNYNFDSFDVTHTATGFTVVKGFERCASAAVAFLALARCADWTKGGEEISEYLRSAAGDEPANVPGFTTTKGGETVPTSKRDVVQSYRGIGRALGLDEFPWEDEETSPHSQADRILAAMFTDSVKGVPHV